MSQIYMDRQKRRRLKEKYKLSDPTISEMMHFKSNSKLAREVRSFAVNVLQAYPVI